MLKIYTCLRYEIIHIWFAADRDDLERDRNRDTRRLGPDSSEGVGRGERHQSGDIRAQFMADLRRLGGNIPTQSTENRNVGDVDGSSDHQTATSTTISPPPHSKHSHPPPQFPSPTATSPSKRSVSCEDNLPPRKRKVSQEHHLTQLNQDTIISINGQRSPHKYNGIHANDGDSGGSTSPTPQAKSSGSSADSEGSTTPAGSPDKSSERILKEDPPSSSQTCEWFNRKKYKKKICHFKKNAWISCHVYHSFGHHDISRLTKSSFN